MDGSYVLPTAPNAQQHSSASALSTPTPASPVLMPVELKGDHGHGLQVSRRERIEAAVEKHDLEQLKKLAVEVGGFESSELRRRVWWVLAGD